MKKLRSRFCAGFISIVVFSCFAGAGAVLSPDDCTQDVNIPALAFPASSLSCQVVWPTYNFILRHNYDKSKQTLNVLLSANFAMNWFAIGFSSNGLMVPASAMIGYFKIVGYGVVEQYYLAGRDSGLVFPDQGNLSVISDTTVLSVQNQTMYMAFQLNMDPSSAAASKIIYAYAYKGRTPNDTGYIDYPHEGTFKMSMDFTTGSASSTSSLVETLEKGHGAANLLAWAILAPAGAFIARYLRERDPLWFYLHAIFQTLAYLFAVGGIALGVKLTYDLPNLAWQHHRILGIFVFFIATLQIIALCWRPNKDSKQRNIWRWYHSLAGRFVLFLAAINIVLGIRLAGTTRTVGAGYAFILIVTLLCFAILESLYWCRWIKKRRQALNNPNSGLSSYEMM